MRMRTTDDRITQVFRDLTARGIAVLCVRFERASTITLITDEPVRSTIPSTSPPRRPPS